jgi:hypothetical protein
MASYQLPEPKRSSSIATLGKKALAATVLLLVAVLAVRIGIGIVAGLISTVLTAVVVVALVVAGVWAVRRL